MKNMKRTSLLLFVLFVFIAFGIPSNMFAEQEPPVFSTWDIFEVDKCASIWLIKRFVHKDAVIKLFPKGDIISEGIPFDVPDAEFRRYHNMSTFESILKHYNLRDPRLLYIGKIIHDIEVNTWERKVISETLIVRDYVNKIILNSKNSDEVLEKSLKYFDSLHLLISKRKNY